MPKFNLSFNSRQNGQPNTQIGILAENQSTAIFLMDIFIGENDLSDVDFKSIKLEEINMN